MISPFERGEVWAGCNCGERISVALPPFLWIWAPILRTTEAERPMRSYLKLVCVCTSANIVLWKLLVFRAVKGVSVARLYIKQIFTPSLTIWAVNVRGWKSTVSCQLSTVSYQLSTVSYQLLTGYSAYVCFSTKLMLHEFKILPHLLWSSRAQPFPWKSQTELPNSASLEQTRERKRETERGICGKRSCSHRSSDVLRACLVARS